MGQYLVAWDAGKFRYLGYVNDGHGLPSYDALSALPYLGGNEGMRESMSLIPEGLNDFGPTFGVYWISFLGHSSRYTQSQII